MKNGEKRANFRKYRLTSGVDIIQPRQVNFVHQVLSSYDFEKKLVNFEFPKANNDLVFS